jgi:serine protease Do
MEKKNKNTSKTITVIVVVFIMLLLVIDIVIHYVPLKDIFTQTVITKTEKDVQITDEGIAEAVDKLYDAAVIVEVGSGEKINGWGSGFVYKIDGDVAYVLTNYHVAGDAKTIKIVYTDESEVDGEFVGGSEYMDVAIVKVPASSVKKVAEIGSSENLRVGDTVFAVGTPVSLQYSFSVTRGILSGKERFVASKSSETNMYGFSQTKDIWYERLLQIDATINSGNSGGALCNSNGEVVGITNSKLSGSTSSSASIENMGFAIPIEDALMVAEQVLTTGKYVRPVLGVTMTTFEAAAQNGMTAPEGVTEGAIIDSVTPGGSAAKAGLQRGDIVIKFGDYKIEDYLYLKYYVGRYKVGDKVEVTYIRNGKEQKTTITLQES